MTKKPSDVTPPQEASPPIRWREMIFGRTEPSYPPPRAPQPPPRWSTEQEDALGRAIDRMVERRWKDSPASLIFEAIAAPRIVGFANLSGLARAIIERDHAALGQALREPATAPVAEAILGLLDQVEDDLRLARSVGARAGFVKGYALGLEEDRRAYRNAGLLWDEDLVLRSEILAKAGGR